MLLNYSCLRVGLCKTVFFFFSLLLGLASSAQKIDGVVIDASTQEPVVYANVAIKGKGLGTITNQQGGFSLNIPDAYRQEILAVSFVGYETFSIKVENIPGKALRIALEPVAAQIEEVVIRADSTIFTLLEGAYERIPINYPDDFLWTTGFYRESLHAIDSTTLYIAEASINNLKSPYNIVDRTGQVEVMKSRKNLNPIIDSVVVARWYGGLFSVNRGDPVFSRYDIIKPASFKKFEYAYLGKTKYLDRSVLIISVKSKDKNQSDPLDGTFYIDEDTQAYVYFDLKRAGKWKKNPLESVTYFQSSQKVLYTREGDKWILKCVVRNQRGMNDDNRKEFILDSEYATTSIEQNSRRRIAYDNQVQPRAIITNLAETYSETFWKDHNIIQEDSGLVSGTSSETFLATEFDRELSSHEKLIRFSKRLNIGYSYYFNQFTYQAQQVEFNYRNYRINNPAVPRHFSNHALGLLIGYKITNRLSVNWVSSSSLSNRHSFVQQFSAEYLMALKNKGRPYYFIPRLAYGQRSDSYKIGTVQIEEEFEIGGKKMKKGDSEVYSSHWQQFASFGFEFKTPLSRLFSLSFGLDYFWYFAPKDYFLFDRGGFFKNPARQDLNSVVTYFEDGIQVSEISINPSNWSFNVGLRFEL